VRCHADDGRQPWEEVGMTVGRIQFGRETVVNLGGGGGGGGGGFGVRAEDI
jgi:hypothetical protein